MTLEALNCRSDTKESKTSDTENKHNKLYECRIFFSD